MRIRYIFFFLLFLGLTILYRTHFGNFFYQDDFFNINLSRTHSLIHAFNIFHAPPSDFVFYRPFSTQLFWNISWKLFGFSPFGYHIISYLFFLSSIYLAYKLAHIILRDNRAALLTSFFYAFSASHFYRLYFLSQFQEISLAFFTFLTLVLFIKKSKWTPLLFFLSLTTKETSVMIVPFMVMLTLLLPKPKHDYLKLFFQCAILLLVYLFARVFFFGFASGQSYMFDFSVRKVFNNLLWYSMWSIGLPEAFVNVTLFKFPTLLNPKLFTEFGTLGNIVLGTFALFNILIVVPLMRFFRTINVDIFIPIFLYLFFLLPILFFPFHKFPYGLAVPLLGSSLIFGRSLSMMHTKYILIVCVAYVALSITAYQFNLASHWANKRALMSEAVFSFLSRAYPTKPDATNIYFRNTSKPMCLYIKINEPYYSKEIYYAINGATGIQLFYGDEALPVFFEDVDNLKHLTTRSFVLEAPQFFR